MKDRKQHVIKMAHRLFIDKGFQATSIQDILDYSGIAKGTFYNYFSSKNELLIALLKTIFHDIEAEREALLVGKDPSDIEVFIKQVELHMELNRSNQTLTLFEEALVTNDEDLKEFIKMRQLEIIRWFYERFLSLFGEDKKPYLLDCAIMFVGILSNSNKYYALASEQHSISPQKVVKYCVGRIVNILEAVSQTEEQLLDPGILNSWIPNREDGQKALQQEIQSLIFSIKKAVSQSQEAKRYFELLDFIHDEIIGSKKPRTYLVEAALSSLLKDEKFPNNTESIKLKERINDYCKNNELL